MVRNKRDGTEHGTRAQLSRQVGTGVCLVRAPDTTGTPQPLDAPFSTTRTGVQVDREV